jgi:hypothetical protein
MGARCCVCSEKRRDFLRSVELLGAWVPMCYACSGRAMVLEPLPQTLAAIREKLIRDRRARERRNGKKDTRVFQYDRRSDDRREGRGVGGEDWIAIEEDMIVEINELLDGSAEERANANEADEELRDDLTRIREMPAS